MTSNKISRVRKITCCIVLLLIALQAGAEIPTEIERYIDNLCKELELDSAMCKAILLKENATCDPMAKHYNSSSGTTDVGLWQLNDRYIWTTFIGYWHFDDSFDAFDWRDNTYIALRHIKYLCTEFSDFDSIVMSYNCGVKAVQENKIPDSTRKYLADVRQNYKEIKHK